MSSTIHNIGINWANLSKFLDRYAPVIESIENGMVFDGVVSCEGDSREELTSRVEVIYDTQLKVYELRAFIGGGWESSETILSPALNSGHMIIHGTSEIQLMDEEANFNDEPLESLVERQLKNLNALLNALLGEKTIELLERLKKLSGHFAF